MLDSTDVELGTSSVGQAVVLVLGSADELLGGNNVGTSVALLIIADVVGSGVVL